MCSQPYSPLCFPSPRCAETPSPKPSTRAGMSQEAQSAHQTEPQSTAHTFTPTARAAP